jgi:hypothetical protein
MDARLRRVNKEISGISDLLQMMLVSGFTCATRLQERQVIKHRDRSHRRIAFPFERVFSGSRRYAV